MVSVPAWSASSRWLGGPVRLSRNQVLASNTNCTWVSPIGFRVAARPLPAQRRVPEQEARLLPRRHVGVIGGPGGVLQGGHWGDPTRAQGSAGPSRMVRGDAHPSPFGRVGAWQSRVGGRTVEITYTPEQEALRDELRAYYDELLDDETVEALGQGDGIGPAAKRVWKQMCADGWLGIGWPKEYGGQGREPDRPVHLLRRVDAGRRTGRRCSRSTPSARRS